MKDIRGIERGFCKDCGEDECSGYIRRASGESNACDYCGCPPAKHLRIISEQHPQEVGAGTGAGIGIGADVGLEINAGRQYEAQFLARATSPCGSHTHGFKRRKISSSTTSSEGEVFGDESQNLMNYLNQSSNCGAYNEKCQNKNQHQHQSKLEVFEEDASETSYSDSFGTNYTSNDGDSTCSGKTQKQEIPEEGPEPEENDCTNHDNNDQEPDHLNFVESASLVKMVYGRNNGSKKDSNCPGNSTHGRWMDPETGKRTGAKSVQDKVMFSLPQFSGCVLSALQGKSDIKCVWDLLIEESAAHYIKYNPGHGSEYKQIGMHTFERFPNIQMPGKLPWSHYTQCLSRKLRKLRMDMCVAGRSSTDDNSSVVSIAKQRITRNTIDEARNMNPMEYQALLIAELSKNKPSEALIKSSLTHTYNLRTHLIRSKVPWSMLLRSFPCLNILKYIEHEAELFFGPDKYLHFKNNVEKLISAILSVEVENDVQKSFANFQKRLINSGELIFFVEDSESFAQKSQLLSSMSSSPPFLLVQHSDNNNRAKEAHENHINNKIAIIAFGSVIPDSNRGGGDRITSLKDGLIIFLTIYLVFELNYPKKFEHFLHFLECFTLGFPPKGFSSQEKLYYDKFLNSV